MTAARMGATLRRPQRGRRPRSISMSPSEPLLVPRRSTRRDKRRNARIGALIFAVTAGAALALSISFDWFGQERRNPTTLVYERRGPLCGFVRGLPVVQDYVGGVPCQVWNLMPLTGLGAVAAGWLLLDLARSLVQESGRPRE